MTKIILPERWARDNAMIVTCCIVFSFLFLFPFFLSFTLLMVSSFFVHTFSQTFLFVSFTLKCCIKFCYLLLSNIPEMNTIDKLCLFTYSVNLFSPGLFAIILLKSQNPLTSQNPDQPTPPTHIPNHLLKKKIKKRS